jgi:hypothetical protein
VVDRLGQKLDKVRVYQDSLPYDGDLGEWIVRETAEKGSKNYQILRRLIDREARIEATESLELLRQTRLRKKYAKIKKSNHLFIEGTIHFWRAYHSLVALSQSSIMP